VPTLCAIVPATNSPATLPRCLAAIGEALEPPEELIVVDGPPHAGPAAARNAGARRTSADVLVFVDADVLVHADVFVRIRSHFDADPELVALFGSYDDAAATGHLAGRFRNLLHHHVHTRSAGPASTFWAGLGAVRRDRLIDVGGFDAARYHHPSIEDIELGMRLTARGDRILLDPSVRGTHLKDWQTWQMITTDFRQRGVPWVELILERRELSATLNLGWIERVSALAAVAGAAGVVTGRPRIAVAATVTLVAANVPFYRLLARKLGTPRAVACIPLHAAHHLAAAAAVPVGAVKHVLSRRPGS
jgi:GT2 family glycosyltransferase